MSLCQIGFCYCIICACVTIYYYKLAMFVFLTVWTYLIQLYTFYCLMTQKTNTTLAKNLLVTSWTLGWAVSFMFWFYVFPLSDSSKLPPVFQYISTHGGINSIMSIVYLKSEISVDINDLKWPLLVITFYFFSMLLPLKLIGITIYPLIFDEFLPTIIAIFGTIIITTLSFFVGYYLKKSKRKNT